MRQNSEKTFILTKSGWNALGAMVSQRIDHSIDRDEAIRNYETRNETVRNFNIEDKIKYMILQMLSYEPMTIDEITTDVMTGASEKFMYTGITSHENFTDNNVYSIIKGLERQKLIKDISDLAIDWDSGDHGFSMPNYH